MVYATINEAWGDSFKIENPTRNVAHFDSFHDDFKKNMNQVLPKKSQRDVEEYREKTNYNDSIEVGHPRKSKYHFPKSNFYSRDLDMDISEVSEPISDVTSVDDLFELKKLRGKKLTIPKKQVKTQENQKEYQKDKQKKELEHFRNTLSMYRNDDNCFSIYEHVKNCENCRNLIENDNKNIFMKEFIIFASSGILMFIFLELLAKILKR